MEYAHDGSLIFDGEDDAAAVLENADLSRDDRLAAEAALEAMREGWDAETLAAEPVLHQGQADDCHVEDQSGFRRIWLSRTGVADGEPFENTVSIEARRDGSWVTIAQYDGGDLPDDEDEDETLSGYFRLGIECGNAAMSSAEDVADAVRRSAEPIEAGDEEGRIFDVNGNTVGRWAMLDKSGYLSRWLVEIAGGLAEQFEALETREGETTESLALRDYFSQLHAVAEATDEGDSTDWRKLRDALGIEVG